MKKYFPHISAFLLTLVIVFTVSGFIIPANTINAQEVGGEAGCDTFAFGCKILQAALPGIAGVVLKFVALLTGLAGIILNGVVYLTVVKVAENYSSIPAISVAWALVRDVANMSFIFVLLYAAIRTILGIGDDAKKLIVNIVVVAILINFSLFFTKVVIDASNVLSIMFYDAIAPNALNSAGTLDLTQRGLSNAFMKHLSIQSLYKVADTGKITFGGIITIGLMGSIMLLIAAFVFFSVAIMFIIRYVVLILVLILSPLAFIAMVLPALKPQANKWRDALIGQAFFAPIYFMLTWVTLSILGGVMSSFNTAIGITTATTTVGALGGISTDALTGEIKPDQDTFSMFINFSVIIVFLIASLIIAKDWANKAGPGVAGMTKWAMGAAGGASFGLAARASRLAGAGLAMSPDSEKYKRFEEKATKGGFGGVRARLNLAAADKIRTSSFDVRGGRLGGILAGAGLESGKAKEGGFEADKNTTREFLELPGTEAYKKRQERGRKAKADLDIRDNLGTVAEHDRLVALETAAAEGGPALSTVDQASLNDFRNPTHNSYAKVNAFEKAINDSTTKEIEVIVESNRKLLQSQQFANRISVQQLEAINKSDKFTESEKDSLRKTRFSSFDVGSAGLAALAIPEASRTPAQKVAAKAASGNIRNLKDAELEMINPELMRNEGFVSTLRTSQIDTVNKSSRFTSGQREALGKVRLQPIKRALIPPAGTPIDSNEIKRTLRELGPKEQAALMRTDGRPGITAGTDPFVLPHYTPKMLRRMVDEMTPGDVQTLRAALEVGGEAATRKWLAANPDNFS